MPESESRVAPRYAASATPIMTIPNIPCSSLQLLWISDSSSCARGFPRSNQRPQSRFRLPPSRLGSECLLVVGLGFIEFGRGFIDQSVPIGHAPNGRSQPLGGGKLHSRFLQIGRASCRERV